MSRADFDKWQARYAQDDFQSREPDSFVFAAIEELERGAVALDVAGGLGRHALAMAARGAQATLLDVSPAGLARAEAEAARRGLSLSTLARDLDEAALPEGPFDLIVVSWFLLPEAVWDQAAAALAEGGRLVYVQPTTTNQERHRHPSPRFLVESGALRAAAEARGLEIVRYEEGWDAADHHTARLVARRSSA